MGSHAKVDNFPSSVVDHKPGIQEAELNGRDDDEVHRGDAVLVISEKRFPALALVLIRVSLWKISRDGGEADRDPELLEFRLNLSSAPAVLIREPTDQGLNL